MTEPDLRALADRLLIRELIDAYSNLVTRQMCSALGDLFVDDCLWRTKGTHPREFRGREQVVEAIAAVVLGYPLIFQMPHASRIEVDGDTATATTLLHEIGKIDDRNGAFALAVYEDSFVRTPAGWKFKERLFQAVYHEGVAMPEAVTR